MQHVTRLYGARFPTRTFTLIKHGGRSYSSYVPLGEQESKPLNSTTTRTLRQRSHGNTALPVSALFDPVTVAARKRHKNPKEAAPEDPEHLTEFQRELEKNAYAHALATPVRTCVLTKARLPAHFLIPFVTDMPPTERRTDAEPEEQIRTRPRLTPRFSPSDRPGPSSYILASDNVIAHLSSDTSKASKAKAGTKWTMLVNERMRRPWSQRCGRAIDAPKVVAKEWEWDEDMVNVVRTRLARAVVGRLQWVLKQEEEACFGKGEEEGVAVVRIGGEKDTERRNLYDLRAMMDAELLVKLQEMSGGKEEIVLKRHSKTWSAHMALEELKNYVQGNGYGT